MLRLPRESFFILARCHTVETIPSWAATGCQEGTLGKLALSSLQSGARGGTQIGCGIYVRPDRGSTTTAKIGGAADLFLPAVFGVAGDGTSTRRRPQHGCVEHDPRPGRLGSGADRGSMGNPARNCWLAAGYRDRRRCSSSVSGSVLRVLMGLDGRWLCHL